MSTSATPQITPDRITSWSMRMVHSILQGYPIEQATWHYEDGLMVYAVAQVGQAFGDSSLNAFVNSWVDHFVSEAGAIRTYTVEEFNLDQVNPGRLLFLPYKNTGLERYHKAIDLIFSQLQHQPRNTSGGFWHKKIYPHQMWLDGLYMAEPFYAEYAQTFDRPELFDDIARQFLLCSEHTRDPETGLLYHAWDETRSQPWSNPITGCSPNFWGRAMGWYVMALADVLDFMPYKHPDLPALVSTLQKLTAALIRYQDVNTGLWYQVVDQAGRDGNYEESSVSAMLAYAFAKAVRKGWLGSEVLLSAQRAYRGLLENQIRVDSTGRLTLQNICGVGGLGGNPYRDGSYTYYIHEPVVANDFKGVGSFVLASLEMEKADLRALGGGKR